MKHFAGELMLSKATLNANTVKYNSVSLNNGAAGNEISYRKRIPHL